MRFEARNPGGSMATQCIPQVRFKFEGLGQPAVARFDTPHASSDGGAVLLKAVDTQLGLTKRLAACLEDSRQPGKIRHQSLEVIRQRVFGIACGYADCNDAARLADDAIHKLLVDRDPLAGPALASQPTLSRFENAVSVRALIAMGHALADTVIEQHRRRLKGRATRITIDLDPTDDPTHGQQEFTFFNGHYNTWCYLPLVATVTFNDEPAQYAVAAVLRPGNAPAKRGARGLLRRLFAKLRAAFPTAILRVRLDGGFAGNPLFKFLEAAGVEYVAGMASNRRLEKRIQRLMVVTNLGDAPQAVYELYCQRGDMENRLKELHHGLEMDRTSCSRFLANQFRVLLTLAAYLLFQELGRRAQGTGCADAQVTTLRERLIKLAVWVERSVRRIVLHLPSAFPWLRPWRQIARAVGATT
jgi:hypothetical protein